MGRPKKGLCDRDLEVGALYEAGFSYKEIGEKLGGSESWARNSVLRCGLKPRKQGTRVRPRELDKKIAAAYGSGMRKIEVMRKLGVSQDKFEAAIRRCGVESRGRESRKKEPDDLDRRAVELYERYDMTYRQVSVELGVSVCRVQNAMKRLGGKSRTLSEAGQKIDEETARRILVGYQAGKGSKVLSEEFGYGPSTILSCVRRLGGEVRGKGSGRRVLTDQQEMEIALRYLEHPERLKVIAKRLDVSRTAVRGALFRWNVQPVNGGEWLRTLTPEEEIKLAVDYLDGSGQHVLSRKYGVSECAVRGILVRQGVSQRSQEEVNAPSIDPQEALRLYEEEYLTFEAIGQRLGCSYSVAAKHIKRLGVEINHARKYRSTDRHFFAEVNITNAYFAGFFAADWCVRQKRNNVDTGLAAKDVGWLEMFKRVAKLPQPIVPYITNLGHAAVRLSICCTQWAYDLEENFGVVPAKAFRLERPPFSYNRPSDDPCIWAFVRGYFDGDGHATDPKGPNAGYIQFTSGSRKFLEWIIREVLEAHHKIYPTNGSWGCYVSGPVARLVVPRMYAGSTSDTRLDRKYDRLVEAGVL